MGDTEGVELLGFQVDRGATSSDDRGNQNPAGNYLVVAPQELALLSSRQPTGYVTSSSSFNIPSKDAGRIPSYNIAYRDEAYWSGVGLGSSAYDFLRAPGALAAVDIEGDGIDELVEYFYDRKGRSETSQHELRLVVYTTGGGYMADIKLDEALGGSAFAGVPRQGTGYDIYKNYPQQAWASMFPMTTGDVDGDGDEDITILYTYAESVDSNTYLAKVDRVTFLMEVNGSGVHYTTNRANVSSKSMPKSNINNYHAYLPASMTTSDLGGDGFHEVVYSLMDDSRNTDKNFLHLLKARPSDGSKAGSNTGASMTFSDSSFALRNSDGSARSGVSSISMLSVSCDDVNGDSTKELVVGGYDNGELFLTYLMYDNKNGSFNGHVNGHSMLYDDNGTHRTTSSSLNSHDRYDTSQYYQDNDSDFLPSGHSAYSTYVNATNWTIPLQAVSLSGISTNDTSTDQVFFGMLFYSFDTESGTFKPYQNTMDLPYKYNDNNNISIISATPMIPDDSLNTKDVDAVNDYRGNQCLMVTLSRDLDADHGSDLAYEVYIYFSDGSGVARYTSETDRTGYDDKTYYPKSTAYDCDDDTLYLKLLQHQFVYSEPMLTGVISAPPYFQDVKDETDYSSGVTQYVQTEGSTSEKGGSVSIDVETSLQLGGTRKIGPAGVGNLEGEWADSIKREYSYTLATQNGQDAASLNVIPADVYVYSVFEYKDGRMVKNAEPLFMTFPCEPVTKLMPLDNLGKDGEDYESYAAKYNEWVTGWNADEVNRDNLFEYLPELNEILNHTAGDPASYNERISGLTGEVFQANKPLSIDHSPAMGNTYQEATVTYDKSHSTQYGGSFGMGITFDRDGLLSAGDATITAAGGGFTCATDSAGSQYVAALNSLSYDYSDYYFSTAFYAGTKVPARSVVTSENDRKYVYLGYTTSNVHCPPAQARDVAVVPNEADFRTGSYALDVSLTLPWDVRETWRANSYELQWLDTHDDTWKAIEGARWEMLESTSERVTFTHEGLDPATTYHYRAVAYRTGASGELLENPTPASSGTTNKAPQWSVSFEADPAACVGVWGYYFDEDNARYSFKSPGKISEYREVLIAAVPQEDYVITGWSVTDGDYPQGKTYTVAELLAGESSLYKVDATGTVFTIKSLEENVTAVPLLELNAVEANAVAEQALAAAAPESQPGNAADETAEPLAHDEALAAELAQQVKNGTTIDLSLDAQAVPGFEVAYDHINKWTNDPKAQVKVNILATSLAEKFAYFATNNSSNPGGEEGGMSLVETDIKGTGSKDEVKIGNLANGNHLLPLVAIGPRGHAELLPLTIKKDDVAPSIDLACVTAYGPARAEGLVSAGKTAQMLFAANPGASDMKAFEMIQGKDVPVDTPTGWQDISQWYNKIQPAEASELDSMAAQKLDSGRTTPTVQTGSVPMKAGWWTVRLTDNAGNVSTASIEVPALPEPGKLVIPEAPEDPNKPGPSDPGTGDPSTPGQPGTTVPTKPAAGPGSGQILLSTGDSFNVVPLASVAVLASLVAGAAGVYLVRQRRRKHDQ